MQKDMGVKFTLIKTEDLQKADFNGLIYDETVMPPQARHDFYPPLEKHEARKSHIKKRNFANRLGMLFAASALIMTGLGVGLEDKATSQGHTQGHAHDNTKIALTLGGLFSFVGSGLCRRYGRNQEAKIGPAGPMAVSAREDGHYIAFPGPSYSRN